MEYILHPEQYNIIYYISFLSLGSSFYALYNCYYGLSICSGCVFLTSIIYWSYPDYSWRRYLDISYVCLALSYQLYEALNSQYMAYYYLLMFVSISMYPIGIYFYNKNLFWHSTYAHCALHIIANIANFVLYTRSNIK